MEEFVEALVGGTYHTQGSARYFFFGLISIFVNSVSTASASDVPAGVRSI
jgi:hypothetical protein